MGSVEVKGLRMKAGDWGGGKKGQGRCMGLVYKVKGQGMG